MLPSGLLSRPAVHCLKRRKIGKRGRHVSKERCGASHKLEQAQGAGANKGLDSTHIVG